MPNGNEATGLMQPVAPVPVNLFTWLFRDRRAALSVQPPLNPQHINAHIIAVKLKILLLLMSFILFLTQYFFILFYFFI
jgi:hypothetical protein